MDTSRPPRPEAAPSPAIEPKQTETPPHWSSGFIHQIEQGIYLIIAAMLILTLVFALAGSARLLWDGMAEWSGTATIFNIIDRLLFVLMLVEILHTVHASIRTGTLLCEPFLVVGLIACIRRILLITLQTSQFTKADHLDAASLPVFHASMLELGVLAALVVVLVGSIHVIRGGTQSSPQE